MNKAGGGAGAGVSLLRGPAALLFALLLVQCGVRGEDRTQVAFLRTVASESGGLRAFLDELASQGYRLGEDLAVYGREAVYPEDEPARIKAAQWNQDDVDLIVALSSVAAQAAMKGAPGTPILFLSNDPVALGLVRDERRPCGRVTGTTFHVPADRTLDLIRRALPGAEPMGVLVPDDDPAARPVLQRLEEAAAQLGTHLVVESFTKPAQAKEAVMALAGAGARVVLPANSPSTVMAFPQIGEAAAAAGLPVVTNTAADFALLVLEPDVEELYRQLARQAARLLAGDRPCDVPVEDPAEYRLTVNLVAAERLGLSLPDGLVADAHQVIRPQPEPVPGTPTGRGSTGRSQAPAG